MIYKAKFTITRTNLKEKNYSDYLKNTIIDDTSLDSEKFYTSASEVVYRIIRTQRK